jgi:hypothetical protein
MTTHTPQCTAYVGSLDGIPSTATPGLLFLKALLPILDSTTVRHGLENLLAPSAVFINNAVPPTSAHAKNVPATEQASPAVPNQTATKLAKRNVALQEIKREFRRAWDMDNGNGRRTVVYESRNHYVFTADPDNPLLMLEAGMIELESIPTANPESQEVEIGVAGVWATELRSWHDRVGMLRKREELGC